MVFAGWQTIEAMKYFFYSTGVSQIGWVNTMQLITAGVDPEIAEYEACLIEHAVSQDSFEKIRDAHKQGKIE